jgi:hypothetical protein
MEDSRTALVYQYLCLAGAFVGCVHLCETSTWATAVITIVYHYKGYFI